MARQAHAAHKVYLDNCVQLSSVICSNGFGSYTPTLLTRTSTAGTASYILRPLRRSQIYGDAADFRVAVSFRILSVALSTRCCVRPVITTDAPSRASVRAIANPIPAVDPVTKVFFPSTCKFIASLFLALLKNYCTQMLSGQKSRSGRNTGLETCVAHRLLSLCSMSLVTWFTIFKQPEWRLDDSLFRSGTCGAPFRWPLSVPVR